MEKPVQVAFKDMDVSDAIEQRCLEEAEKLERYFDHIIGCRVVIAQPHKKRQQGNLFEIRIDVTVPGKELVVNREPPKHQRDEDPYVALKDAFERMRRQLEAYARKLRGDVKTSHAPPHGKIVRIFPEQGYGFIQSLDGEELYFHRNAVLNGGFDSLQVGQEVQYAEEYGIDGPQASTVKPVGRHHHTLS